MISKKALDYLKTKHERLKVSYVSEDDSPQYIITERTIQRTFDTVNEYKLYGVLKTGEIVPMFKGDDPLKLEERWKKRHGI